MGQATFAFYNEQLQELGRTATGSQGGGYCSGVASVTGQQTTTTISGGLWRWGDGVVTDPSKPDGEWAELGEWIEFKEMDNASVLIELLNFFKSRFNKQEGITKMADIDVKAITEQVKSDLQKQFEAQFKTQYSEKFKEEFGVTPEQFRETLARDIARWAEVVRRSGATVD